jgi:hypothetical protein
MIDQRKMENKRRKWIHMGENQVKKRSDWVYKEWVPWEEKNQVLRGGGGLFYKPNIDICSKKMLNSGWFPYVEFWVELSRILVVGLVAIKLNSRSFTLQIFL